jgi:PLP dependent protein
VKRAGAGSEDMNPDGVRENLLKVQERIAAAARRAGRRSEQVTLIGVSKTHPAEAILAAYEAGLRHFGENRVQEWEGKRVPVEGLAATWHLIGHLQSNKAARAAALFHCVDSVDNLALAQRLDRARHDLNAEQKLRVLLEVRLAAEETKSGASTEELPALAEKITMLPRLELAGLMCIPPLLEDAEAVRPYFRRLRELRDELAGHLGRALPVLSMGMSHDFETAIEEGATEVRVGTALFGQRPAAQISQAKG